LRLGVVSDSHRYLVSLEYAVKQMGKIDMLLHAGDLYSDAEHIEGLIGVPVIAVAGNCDYINAPSEREITIAGKKIFLVHGHKFGVKLGIERIGYYAEEKGYDVVIFGHTHTPLVTKWGETLLLNPGSVGLPRGTNQRTFGIIELRAQELQGRILPLVE